MYMISRNRISGTEFQVWALTQEKIRRQNRKDTAARRRGIIRSFCSLLAGTYDGNSITDIVTSVENHLVAFAAEVSRLNGSVVDLRAYEEEVRKSTHQA